jgi:hypothetical protein
VNSHPSFTAKTATMSTTEKAAKFRELLPPPATKKPEKQRQRPSVLVISAWGVVLGAYLLLGKAFAPAYDWLFLTSARFLVSTISEMPAERGEGFSNRVVKTWAVRPSWEVDNFWLLFGVMFILGGGLGACLRPFVEPLLEHYFGFRGKDHSCFRPDL